RRAASRSSTSPGCWDSCSPSGLSASSRQLRSSCSATCASASASGPSSRPLLRPSRCCCAGSCSTACSRSPGRPRCSGICCPTCARRSASFDFPPDVPRRDFLVGGGRQAVEARPRGYLMTGLYERTPPGVGHNSPPTEDKEGKWERWSRKRTFVRALEGTYSDVYKQLL